MKRLFAQTILFSLLLLSQSSRAQDWHYSQFHASPLMVNPGFTGLFNGDIRFITNYKDQWSFAAPYRTFSFSADGAFAILKNGDFASGGLQVLADRAGDLNFTTLKTAANFSYSKALSGYGNHFLTLGFEAGINRRYVDYTKMVAFDPEPYATSVDNNFNFADISTGLTWYFLPSDEIYVYAGGSIFHLNQPNQSFLQDGSDILERRYSLQAGMQFPVTDNVNLLPSLIYNEQGPHREFVIGTYLKYKLSHVTVRQETAMYVGVWYRNKDAVVTSIRFDHNNVIAGISYDINTSTLSAASYGRGGLELNLIYILDKKFNSAKRMKNRSYQCPKF
ncbi:MAG TPA: PorP/SprF family type IX secretion system membrane protein [Chitinophagales bacterium]|nr:PorP/SprF family type IX secretion system membrane protein [Chitinophagales bacterium]